jgi:DNA polymerase III subunit gamma/tau
MIVESLPNKYRPKTWDDLVGQDTTVKRLKNIISTGKIPSAFLFVGGTGIGKTTISRLLAAYLSCEKEKDVAKFDAANHPDLIEINAGADSKIDDIRELINLSRFKPQRSKYKIVCIDEAQAILQAARNALLKPLEEPPKHTIYILSSMEPDKLNSALVGRCSVFTLDNVNIKDISKRLLYIADKEKFKWLDKDLSLKIAEYSNGSVRQAVSNLEAVSQYAGDNKKLKDTDKILSSLLGVESTLASEILISLYSKKIKSLHNSILCCDALLPAINKMSYYNLYVLDCLLCQNNKKVAHWGENKKFYSDAKKYIDDSKDFLKYALKIQDSINTIKIKLGTFMSNDRSVVVSELSRLIMK